MERLDKDALRSLQRLYLHGITLYKDLDTNTDPVARVRCLRQAIAGWNKCERELNGKSTS